MSAAVREPSLSDRLTDFLQAAGEPVDVVGWKPLTGGRSAETIRVTLRGPGGERQCVVHLEPESGPLAGVSNVASQFAVLGAVERAGIPASRALWLCPDPAVLGRPFLVTDFAPGEVPTPWRAEGRRFLERHPPGGPLARAFVETLTRIHALGPDDVPPAARGADPAAARTFAEHERRRWSAIAAQSPAFADDPVLAYADAWLAARHPAAAATPGLVHGDYRAGNLVVDGERIVAVLDWELAEAGDPVYDLGVLCSPPLRTNELASGLWEPDALVSFYEETSGRAVDRDALHHHTVLATFRIMSLWVNASREFSQGAEDLASLRAGYSALEVRSMLAEVLGLRSSPGTGAAARPAARAAATLARTLREEVLPAVGSDPSTESLRTVLAVLRVQQAAASGSDVEGFAHAVNELARVAREEGHGAVEVSSGEPPVALLAQLVRRLMAVHAIAGDEDHPLHKHVRTLVGRASSPGLATWPC